MYNGTRLDVFDDREGTNFLLRVLSGMLGREMQPEVGIRPSTPAPVINLEVGKCIDRVGNKRFRLASIVT
jgi:hypothetical protein